MGDASDGRVLIVRLWQEPGASDRPDEAFRGRVEDVESGGWRHFVGLRSLIREIMVLVGKAEPPKAADQSPM